MGAPTETYIDPADGAAAGNDHGGAAFVDGSFANATNTLTKVGAFPAATCQAGDKLYLDDNGSGEVTAGLYTISARTDDDNIVLTADIRSGAPDPTDVRCDQHTGAVGLPWATVQHALDFTTRDGANGDRFNVKAGTDDVLAAALDVTGTYGTPTASTPAIFQGYTTAAGDGGIGGISGNNSVAVIAAGALDFIHFVDMHLHNTGANSVISLDNNCIFFNCEIDNNTSGDGIDVDRRCFIISCHIHDIAGRGAAATGEGFTLFCHFENDGGADMTVAATANGQPVMFCTFDIDGATDGIGTSGAFGVAIGNSIYSTSGTGQGIIATGIPTIAILNNVIEGFSGVGGIGIEVASGDVNVLGFNAFYNNTTNETLTGDVWLDLGNDQVLTASPFIDAANDDFRVKPSVQALGYPVADYPSLAVRSYLDIGALQRMSQMLTHSGMAGGARG